MVETTTWFLVCDASRARLFMEASRRRGLSLVEQYEHPQSRARVSELTTDANGRKPVGPSRGVNGRQSGAYGRPGAEPDTDPKDVEALKFARSLAEVLERGFDAHAYDALVITAPPRFLGLLKETLPEKVLRRLTATVDKDLSLLPPRDIQRRMLALRAA